MKTYGISAVSIIVNKFVTRVVSNTERTKCGISHKSTLSAAIKYGRSARIYVITTNTKSAIRLGVFSNSPLASPSKQLNSIG